jgi:hypothetical protein
MAYQVSQIAEFIPVDTRTNSGTIVLPIASAISGRVLTFKDMYGSFGTNPLFLSTQAGDLFEDTTNLKAMRNTFGYATLASDGISEWNTLDGTLFPMYTMSTLITPLQLTVTGLSTNLATSPLSSFGTRVSTIGFQDQHTGAILSLYSRSTILYYGALAVAGVKAGAGQFLTVS